MHWLVWRYNIFCGELAALEYFSFITLYERAIISPFEIITIVPWSAEQCVLFGTSYNVALFLHCLHTDSSIAVIIAKCTQCIGAFSSCIFKVEMQGNHLQYTAFQKGNVLAFVYMSCLDGEHWLMCGSGRRPSSSPIQTSLRLHALHYVFWLLPLYFFCLSLKLAALCHSLMFRTSLVILSSYSQFSALGFSFFFVFFSSSPSSTEELDASNYPSFHIISPSPLLLWLAPAVFKQSDRPLWPMILSGPDSLLSPWWRMAEAFLCLVLNYCCG